LLTIRPWEANMLALIEKAILKSDLGLTPNNDGKLIRLAIPRLSEERRKELVKKVKARLEEAKVAVRNTRRDAIDDMKELQDEKLITEDDFYDGKKKLDEMIDEANVEIEKVADKKEEDIKAV